jgi:hypothetical protein
MTSAAVSARPCGGLAFSGFELNSSVQLSQQECFEMADFVFSHGEKAIRATKHVRVGSTMSTRLKVLVVACAYALIQLLPDLMLMLNNVVWHIGDATQRPYLVDEVI